MTPKTLVTGSAGFIGGHAVRALQQAGVAVEAATRDGRPGSRRLDLRDPVTFAAALDGIGAVVHCAVGGRAVTVDGTAALLRAAAAAGVGRFVHISSVAVYGRAAGAAAETTPMVPPGGNGYAAWKAAAEQACLAQPRLAIVRLRPSIVYGPGGALWVGRYVRRIRAGQWGTLADAAEGTCNPVHVADVAGAIHAALLAPQAAGHAFNVNGPQATTWNGWFSRVAAAAGAPPLAAISARRVRLLAYASVPARVMARLRPGFARTWLDRQPGPGELAIYAHRVTYPTDAARAGLGWSPAIGIDEGLADAVRSFA